MNRFTRRDMLRGMGQAAAGAALATMHTAVFAKTGKRPPNIIFIMADDLGYGDLGCYGQDKIQTPCIDRMAAEGMRFTQCYAGSTVCAPSRCCLMTGLHTGHAHVRGNKRVPLRPEDVTVAEVLKGAGYRTALVGKWGLGEPETTGVPNRQGFDEFFGYLNQGHAHNYYPEYLWRNEEKVVLEGNVESEEHKGVSVSRNQYSHDLMAREALDFVERAKGSPFFLYLAYTIPHANNERGRHGGDGMEVPSYAPYESEDWPTPHKGHAAMITRMDKDVGKLIERLKTLGIEDNTIVFFTSDNGTHKEGGADPAFFKSSGPLKGYKRDLYEGGIRVPMIVRWPGKVRPGTVTGQVTAFWDFLPTAAELARTKAPDGIDGVSIASALFGSERERDDLLYWEFHERAFKRAVRMGDWKGVSLGPDKPLRLYDLAKDIGEVNDVAEDHPGVVSRIEAFLSGARTDSEHWPLKKR